MKIVLRAPRAAAVLPQISSGGIAMSLLIHVALAGMIALLLGARSEIAAPQRVYTVSLVEDPLPGPGGGSPRPAPATPVDPEPTPPPDEAEETAPPPEVEPEPQPQPPQAPPPRRPDPKPVEPPPLPTPKPTAEPTTPVRQASPPPAVATNIPQPPTPVGEGSGLAIGSGGDLEGVPTIDSAAFPFAYYRAILTNRLRSTWSRPLIPGGLNAPIRVTVRFEVLRTGALANVSLVSSSRYPPLDRSALRAVYDANPLPPLPEEFNGNRLAVHFFFELVPEG